MEYRRGNRRKKGREEKKSNGDPEPGKKSMENREKKRRGRTGERRHEYKKGKMAALASGK